MSDETLKLNRRNALRLIATTAASVPVVGCGGNIVAQATTTADIEPVNTAEPIRTATDPDLLNPTVPWHFVLDDLELATLAALCDVIIPADETSPSASSLDAHHYINEHVSAPYESNKADLVLVRGGIVWLNSESQKRFSTLFIELNNKQKTLICDDIKWVKTAGSRYQTGAIFFEKIRNLTATAFYTTDEGMVDIGYVGNKPSVDFDGPSPEILNKLGLK